MVKLKTNNILFYQFIVKNNILILSMIFRYYIGTYWYEETTLPTYYIKYLFRDK